MIFDNFLTIFLAAVVTEGLATSLLVASNPRLDYGMFWERIKNPATYIIGGWVFIWGFGVFR